MLGAGRVGQRVHQRRGRRCDHGGEIASPARRSAHLAVCGRIQRGGASRRCGGCEGRQIRRWWRSTPAMGGALEATACGKMGDAPRRLGSTGDSESGIQPTRRLRPSRGIEAAEVSGGQGLFLSIFFSFGGFSIFDSGGGG
ncbi:formin-like protein 5 [Iris pallida]|uniref:Formin-like protein 5 n=1 Tax=Iris pallida TaxID=29817 RepID=A0AAX6I4L0_IRIPA|nr:formin-like protein 5 [Iris pallida]